MQVNKNQSISFGVSTRAQWSVRKYASDATKSAMDRWSLDLVNLGEDVKIRFSMRKFYKYCGRQLVVKIAEKRQGFFKKAFSASYAVDESNVFKSVTESKNKFIELKNFKEDKKFRGSLFGKHDFRLK